MRHLVFYKLLPWRLCITAVLRQSLILDFCRVGKRSGASRDTNIPQPRCETRWRNARQRVPPAYHTFQIRWWGIQEQCLKHSESRRGDIAASSRGLESEAKDPELVSTAAISSDFYEWDTSSGRGWDQGISVPQLFTTRVET